MTSPNQDRALGKIGFMFLVAGKQNWATGEYETYVQEGESQEEAMVRASDNALQIAFEIRDAFVRRSRQSSESKEQ